MTWGTSPFRVMEGDNLSAEWKRKVEKHPLTVSRTGARPAAAQDWAAQQSGQGSHDHAAPIGIQLLLQDSRDVQVLF